MDKIVVYGIGKIGKGFVDKCIDSGIKDIRITDSNRELWGQKYRNIIIQEPQSAFLIKYDQVIIAMGEKNRQEVTDKLVRLLGVPDSKIAYYKDFVVLTQNAVCNLGDMQFKKDNTSTGIINVKELCAMLDRENFNDLEKFFFEKEHRIITKWLHYFEAYDRFFSKYRGKNVSILEIGVYKGGSLQMWKNYFQGSGNEVKIYGIDIDANCKEFEEKDIQIFIGSQEDRNFLGEIKDKIGSVDILIDDGGHTMRQQIITLEELFDLVAEDGIYLCEDIHTSYMEQYGGEYEGKTFVEYSKKMIDDLHSQYSETDKLVRNKYSEEVKAITYFDSMIFIEKKKKTNKSISVELGTV